MVDKNGIEIRTGMIVKVSGAYFKTDNALYYVACSPGDPNWLGRDYSLKKICKNGKISTAKYSVCFWPISVFVSDPWKRAAAKEWNAEHAQIEVVSGIDRSAVAENFKEKAVQMGERIEYGIYNYGEESETVKEWKDIKRHFESVANEILNA